MELISLEHFLQSVGRFLTKLPYTYYHALFKPSLFFERISRGAHGPYIQPYSFLYLCWLIPPLIGVLVAEFRTQALQTFLINYKSLNAWELIQQSFIPFGGSVLIIHFISRRKRIPGTLRKVFLRVTYYTTGLGVFTVQSTFVLGLILIATFNSFLLSIIVIVACVLFVLHTLSKGMRGISLSEPVFLDKLKSGALRAGLLSMFFFLVSFVLFVYLNDTRIPIKVSAKNYPDHSPYYKRYLSVAGSVKDDSTVLYLDLMILNTADKKNYISSTDTFQLSKEGWSIPFTVADTSVTQYLDISSNEFIHLKLSSTISGKRLSEVRMLTKAWNLTYPFYTVDKTDFVQTFSTEKVDSLEWRVN